MNKRPKVEVDGAPWHVTKGRRNWVVRDRDNNYVCDVMKESTAHKIAAAPTLEVALINLVDDPNSTTYCDHCQGYPQNVGLDAIPHSVECPMAAAYAALAKARGET